MEEFKKNFRFENLKCSTCTIMVYTNLEFNMKNIFMHTYRTHVLVPLTKKQKNVDKRKLIAPYGSIISLQYGNSIRGVDLRKKKKKWCPMCQPKDVNDVKIMTVTDVLKKSDIQNEWDDIMDIWHNCNKCGYLYKKDKLEHFLNQVTVLLSLKKKPILNIMLFKNSIKIAGCKNETDAIEAIMILWENYLVPMSKISQTLTFPKNYSEGLKFHKDDQHLKAKDKFKFIESSLKPSFSLDETELSSHRFRPHKSTLEEIIPQRGEDGFSLRLTESGNFSQDMKNTENLFWKPKDTNFKGRIKFVIDIVMKNVDFSLGYNISRQNLNKVMNKKKYSKHVFMSQYESTGQTNVNTKMDQKKPEKYKLTCLVFSLSSSKQPYLTKILEDKIVFRTPKKEKKPKYNTFIVFASSKTILSGRYDEDMERALDIFLSIVYENQDEIKQVIKPIDNLGIKRIISEIKGL